MRLHVRIELHSVQLLLRNKQMQCEQDKIILVVVYMKWGNDSFFHFTEVERKYMNLKLMANADRFRSFRFVMKIPISAHSMHDQAK